MPIYTYRCRQCGIILDQVVKFEDRDKLMFHEGSNDWEKTDPAYREVCGGSLERQEGLELPTIGKEGFQMKAVTNQGHVPGHFGKSARKKKGWNRP
jgi:hypothetical protein